MNECSSDMWHFYHFHSLYSKSSIIIYIQVSHFLWRHVSSYSLTQWFSFFESWHVPALQLSWLYVFFIHLEMIVISFCQLLGIYHEGKLKNIRQTVLEDARCIAIFKSEAAASCFTCLRVQNKVKFPVNIHIQWTLAAVLPSLPRLPLSS